MSLSFTRPPFASRRTTISLNSFGVIRRPFAVRVNTFAPCDGMGDAPTEPTDACTFCFESAAITSSELSPCAAMRSGSIHTRMAIFGPYTVASPTPGMRSSTGRMLP